MSERKTKGTKAAGASRLADLVSGTSPAFGFGAKNAFASTATHTSSLSSLLPEETDHLDAELKVLVKRLSKKDAQTKIKATEDLKTYFSQAAEADLANFVFIWPKIFNRSALDVERKIRENMIACQSILFSRLKKEMAPVLKQLIGPWLCLQFDTSNDISKLAAESFQGAFPNKQSHVLSFCQEEICSFASDNIVYHTVETISDARYNTPEEMVSKYVRVVSGSFSMLSFLYENVSNVATLNDTTAALFENPKFWETTKSTYAPVRRSMYSLLKTLALVDRGVSPISHQLATVKTSFLNECFADKEQVSHDMLWDAVLALTQNYPEVWSVEDVKGKKNAASRLFRFLENACYGSATASYPALLALLAHIPKDALFAVTSDGSIFRDRFFGSFWAGLSSTNLTVGNSSVFVTSIQECSLFFVLKYGDERISSTSNETDFFKIAPISLALLCEALLFPATNPDARIKLSAPSLEAAIISYIAKLASTSSIPDSYANLLVSAFCNVISSTFVNGQRLDGSAVNEEEFAIFCERAGGIISTLSYSKSLTSVNQAKFSALAETLSVEALRRMCAPDAHLKPSILLFTNLSVMTVSETTRVTESLRELITNGLTPLLIDSPADSISLIESIVKRLASNRNDDLHASFIRGLVETGSLEVQSEYLQKISSSSLKPIPVPEFDDFILNLLVNNAPSFESLELVADSMILNDGVSSLSEKGMSTAITMIREGLELALSACLAETAADHLQQQNHLDLLNRLASKSMKSIMAVADIHSLVAVILELSCFNAVATGASSLAQSAEALWFKVADSVDKNDALAEVVVSRWRTALLSEAHKATSSDLIKLYSTAYLYNPEGSKQETLASMALFDSATWEQMKSGFQRSQQSLAIFDPSYMTDESDASNKSISLFSSQYSRFARTLAGVFSLTGVVSSDAFGANVFELVMYWSLCKDEEHIRGLKSDLDFDGQVDDVLALSLASRDAGSWPADAMAVLNGSTSKRGFFVDAFKQAVNGSAIQGRAFAKIAKSGYGLLSASGKAEILGVMKTLFENGSYTAVVPLCHALQKSFNPESSATFVVSLCRSSQIPKSDLANKAAVDRASAGLFMIKTIVKGCKDLDGEAFASGLKSVVKHFRTWFMFGNDVRTASVPDMLKTRVAEFLAVMVEGLLGFDINVAGFVVELTKVLIEDLGSSKLVLFNALDLYQCIAMADSENWTTMDKFSDSIYEICFTRFISECSGEHRVAVAKPQNELQSRLANICEDIPFSILAKMKPHAQLSEMMRTYNTEAQIMAYRLLAKLTFKLVETISVKLEMSLGGNEEAIREKYISQALMHGIKEEPPFVEPSHLVETRCDLHSAFGLLLSWMALLDHFIGATYELRTSLINELKEEDPLPKLLEFIFYTLGVGWTTKPFDLTGWEFSAIEVEGLDLESELGFNLLCAHLYYRVLRNIPALARTWWSSCKDRQLTQAVEVYTDKWFTPILVQAEIDLVLQAGNSALEDVELRASKQAGEITASYRVDEASADTVVRFPPAFPMKPVEFTSNSGGRTIGVQETKWRSWMLSANIVAQNTAIMDALSLWQKNIKLHFEGIEECAICYSVVGVIDRTLPSKSCRTCKNKFHASCLYKWIRTSGNTQCPMCRSEL
ncbi:listerin E3 ubiquitin protein ligase 1 [Chytriomyces hyalinus]|nr:listerin E3 ubiquitin protein ligase 1 [Chytriomyces hyalinus]